MQMDLALQQIEAIERFNNASAKQTRTSTWLVALQTCVAVVAVVISFGLISTAALTHADLPRRNLSK
jgi:hypothetical protein